MTVGNKRSYRRALFAIALHGCAALSLTGCSRLLLRKRDAVNFGNASARSQVTRPVATCEGFAGAHSHHRNRHKHTHARQYTAKQQWL